MKFLVMLLRVFILCSICSYNGVVLYKVGKKLYAIEGYTQHGKMRLEWTECMYCDTLYMVLGMYMVWQKECRIGQRLWYE